MSKFYCHACAIKLGLINTAVSMNFTATIYQQHKFFKHTTPTGYYPVISVYDDFSYSMYQFLAGSAQSFGFLEIDDQGRKNLIAPAGYRIGETFQSGMSVVEDDAVKFVNPNDPLKGHHFSTGSSALHGQLCVNCGQSLA